VRERLEWRGRLNWGLEAGTDDDGTAQLMVTREGRLLVERGMLDECSSIRDGVDENIRIHASSSSSSSI
jgi:hypothetical protein